MKNVLLLSRCKTLGAGCQGILRAIILFTLQVAPAIASTCYGTLANGRLEGGVQLPAEGTNYIAYSSLAIALGRTYVH